MSESEPATSTALESSTRREVRTYSDDDKYQALAFVDVCGGNVYRAAKAAGVPRVTLMGWLKTREERRRMGVEPSAREKENRGDLAAKMESVLHSAVEAMPGKLDKATFSQTAVGVGILTDKIRILRSTGLDPNPEAELCRILNISRAQLPSGLALNPDDRIPDGLADVIDLHPNQAGTYEPVPALSPLYHHPDLGNLSTSPDQDRLPAGYVRLTDPANQVFTLKLSELRPITTTQPEPNDDQLLDNLNEEDQEN